MAFDQHRNLISTLVAAPPSPSTSGTTVVVTSGSGALFPSAPFNCVVYSPTIFPTSANAEVIRVTNISGDTFTIARTQESSVSRAVAIGDIISLTITAKTITDVESAITNLNNAFSWTGSQGSINSTLVLGSSNARYTNNVGWQFFNPTTGLWHTLLCIGNPPTLGWDAGQS